jgi:hypothetical protein
MVNLTIHETSAIMCSLAAADSVTAMRNHYWIQQTHENNMRHSFITSIYPYGPMYVCVRGGPNQPLHRDPQWSIVLPLQMSYGPKCITSPFSNLVYYLFLYLSFSPSLFFPCSFHFFMSSCSFSPTWVIFISSHLVANAYPVVACIC